jgi:hypothetical protein
MMHLLNILPHSGKSGEMIQAEKKCLVAEECESYAMRPC